MLTQPFPFHLVFDSKRGEYGERMSNNGAHVRRGKHEDCRSVPQDFQTIEAKDFSGFHCPLKENPRVRNMHARR